MSTYHTRDRAKSLGCVTSLSTKQPLALDSSGSRRVRTRGNYLLELSVGDERAFFPRWICVVSAVRESLLNIQR
jgi:hypothetical protein